MAVLMGNMLSKNGGYPNFVFFGGGHVNHRGVGVPYFQTRLFTLGHRPMMECWRLLMPSSGEELCSRQRSYLELPADGFPEAKKNPTQVRVNSYIVSSHQGPSQNLSVIPAKDSAMSVIDNLLPEEGKAGWALRRDHRLYLGVQSGDHVSFVGVYRNPWIISSS